MSRRKSSAKFISYDLRPAKQSERGMLVDILRIGGDCGLPIRQYRYVGMGANRFYDFLLMHKYLGIRRMTSLEHDPPMFERASYNVPYRFIDVLNEKVVNFLATDRSDNPEVFWLDYDGGIGPEPVGDIQSMSTRMKLGDFCFVTVGGEVPPALDGNIAERLTKLQDVLGDAAGNIHACDVENASYVTAVHKVLMAAFRGALAPRRDGVFVPLLQVHYSDSMSMVTVGGALLNSGMAADYRAKMKLSLPFLSTLEENLYRIRSFNLTEPERSLFDRATTARKTRCAERNLLKKFGFSDTDFEAYRELLRYLPRYVETVV